MSEAIKLTKAAIDRRPANGKDQYLPVAGYPGLFLRIRPSGSRTFYVRKKSHGRHLRVKVCTYGELPLTSPNRKSVVSEAHDITGQILAGVNPNQARRVQAAHDAAVGITLSGALNDYIEKKRTRTGKPLADRTRGNYRQAIEGSLHDWLDLPLPAITGNMVRDRYLEIAEQHPALANTVMRILQAVWNWQRDRLADDNGENSPLPEPPTTRRLKGVRVQDTRRETYIEPSSLPAWWAATEKMAGTRIGDRGRTVGNYKGDGLLARDFLQFVALTGVRRREATHLLVWGNVNLKTKVFEIPDTKNGQTLRLPMSDYLQDLLERRKQAATNPGKDDRVFPIEETKGIVQWVRDESGVRFTVHDLRRGFASYANALDLGMYSIKELLNHARDTGDVTAGYIQIGTEQLREPMQRITDYILKATGVRETPVICLEATRHGR